jgi:hypothetical protein
MVEFRTRLCFGRHPPSSRTSDQEGTVAWVRRDSLRSGFERLQLPGSVRRSGRGEAGSRNSRVGAAHGPGAIGSGVWIYKLARWDCPRRINGRPTNAIKWNIQSRLLLALLTITTGVDKLLGILGYRDAGNAVEDLATGERQTRMEESFHCSSAHVGVASLVMITHPAPEVTDNARSLAFEE